MPNRKTGVSQRIRERGKARNAPGDEAFVQYALDRLLFRLGRSKHRQDFILKGGLALANVLGEDEFRVTRDADFLRRHGPSDPEQIKEMFAAIAAVEAPDNLTVLKITAHAATRESDGYDGVKLFIEVQVENHRATLPIDIGFGDVMEPPPIKATLRPFLEADPPAQVMAYALYTNVAEKVHGPIDNLPDFEHRLKDVLDLVLVAQAMELDGAQLAKSVAATFDGRRTPPRTADLDKVLKTLGKRDYRTRWATTLKDRRVKDGPDLVTATAIYEALVRPVLAALEEGDAFDGEWREGAWTRA